VNLNRPHQIFDAIVVGAGAAGLMCALTAGRLGKKIMLLEWQERAGKKILISGGGRCNFTNLYSTPENFLSENAHFCKSALARFTPKDFISLIESHGIEYYEKTLGQLFCKLSAKQVTGMLLEECRQAEVELQLGANILDLSRSEDGSFTVKTDQGTISSRALVIATGGLSYANLGASDFGYRIAEQFGLEVHPPCPGLVPLLWNAEDRVRYASLSGVSCDSLVSLRGKSFREALLFTHRGLSGPAILQISSYWRPGDAIAIDLLPEFNARDWLLDRKTGNDPSFLKNALSGKLPKRLAETWSETNTQVAARPIREIADKELVKIAEQLKCWKIMPSGTDGYENAEVTLGGIATSELSSKTMESRKVPGLYFIGEVVDVTGHLGGHNFQWAWASGFAAGNAL